MQADQTVLSLRPGGGSRGSRVLGPRFDSSAFGSSDLPVLRPHGGAPTSFSIKTGDSRFDVRERVRYTRDLLLQLREIVDIPEDILKIKQEVEAEFFGEDQNWVRGETNTGDSWFDGRERVCYTRDQLLQLRELQNQSQSRYSEPYSRDWRGRSAQFPTSVEKSWETNRENREFDGRCDSRQPEANQYNRQDQLNSQFARAQGVAPVSSAEVPHNIFIPGIAEVEEVITEIPPPGEVASSLASAGEATFSAKVVEATEQAVSVVPEESPNQSSSDEDSSCDTPVISVPLAQHLKGLLSEDLGTTEETRTLLNKLFEDRPETFTADCIRSNFDIMIIKLRTLAMIIQKIMDTPLSGLSQKILSKYRRNLNDMVKEGFNVQWLTSQLIHLKELPTQSLQSRFHQNTSELMKLQNDLQVLSSKKVKAAKALASAQKLVGDIELEEAAMTERVVEVTGLQEQVIADVTARFGCLGDKFFSSSNLSFLL